MKKELSERRRASEREWRPAEKSPFVVGARAVSGEPCEQLARGSTQLSPGQIKLARPFFLLSLSLSLVVFLDDIYIYIYTCAVCPEIRSNI